MRRLPPDVELLLEASRLPWRLIEGKRHFKLIVGTKFCAILPKGPVKRQTSHPGHAQQNVVAQIRRAIREQKP